jgi:hypothetical protein
MQAALLFSFYSKNIQVYLIFIKLYRGGKKQKTAKKEIRGISKGGEN